MRIQDPFLVPTRYLGGAVQRISNPGRGIIKLVSILIESIRIPIKVKEGKVWQFIVLKFTMVRSQPASTKFSME